jgi:ABC-type amino acid transport substrate-binding protein
MHTSADQQVLERIRAEYLEMPGLNLKANQVQRLCGVERGLCKDILDALVDRRFLYLKSDGTYARLIDGELPRPRPLPKS